MKIASWIVAIMFFLAAVVQFNDTDALIWIVLYLGAAVFSALSALDKLPVKLASYFAVGCFFFFVYLAIREVRTGRLAWHDGMFEVFGVLLIAVWTNWTILVATKFKPSTVGD